MTAIPATNSSAFEPANFAGDEPIVQTLQRLETRPSPDGWGPVGSFFAALFTLGLYPLLRWPARWSDVIEADRNDFVALAAFWRRRAAPVDAQRMDAALERMQPWPLLMSVPGIIFWFMAVVFGIFIYNNGLDVDLITSVTYGWDRGGRLFQSIDMMHLHKLWVLKVVLGYDAQWIVVRSHRWAVSAFLASVNRAAGPDVPLRWRDRIGSGLSPLWVIGAIVLCANSAWWGIPFALAGALQRRYSLVSPSIRAALAEQLRFALQISPGTPNVSDVLSHPVVAGSFCHTRGCAARLPTFARFCPRCGASVNQTTV